MNEERTEERTPGRQALLVAAVTLLIALPVTLTLSTVRIAPDEAGGPSSPYGYTVSLSLFLVPVVALLVWYLRFERYEFDRRFLWWSVAWLFLLGAALDVFLATTLFEFEDHAATLGLNVPVVGGSVPIEEFVFYLSGFLAVLLTYIWCDETWLKHYNRDRREYEDEAAARPLAGFHWWSVGLGAALVAAAWLYEEYLSGRPEGFPLYFIYLAATALVPSVGLYGATRKVINWPALGFTLAVLVLVSLLWEVTLALPYGWWNYDHHWMMGIKIKAWHDLPIEAVLVWLVAAFTTVEVYEAIKLLQASKVGPMETFLGRKRR